MTAPNDPTQPEVMSRVLDQAAADLMVCAPGIVESFTPATQTARIRSATLKPDGTERTITVQTPVVFPGPVYWHVQDGSEGLLVAADRDWKTWWRTGEVSAAESEGTHELSFSFFIPGVMSRPNTSSRTLTNNSTTVDKAAAGGFVILGDPGATKEALHEDLLTDLSTMVQALDTWATAIDNIVYGGAGPNIAPLSAAILTIVNGIIAGDYQSPSVLVED